MSFESLDGVQQSDNGVTITPFRQGCDLGQQAVIQITPLTSSDMYLKLQIYSTGLCCYNQLSDVACKNHIQNSQEFADHGISLLVIDGHCNYMHGKLGPDSFCTYLRTFGILLRVHVQWFKT